MCQDTCEPICFRLGMMLNTTKVCCFIPVWMTLIFTQGHRVMGKVDLVQSFCCKVTWSNSNGHDGWLCKENDQRSPVSIFSSCFSCFYLFLCYVEMLSCHLFKSVNWTARFTLIWNKSSPLSACYMFLFSHKRRISVYTRAVLDFNFSAAPLDSEPCSVTLLFENTGTVATDWSVLCAVCPCV